MSCLLYFFLFLFCFVLFGCCLVSGLSCVQVGGYARVQNRMYFVMDGLDGCLVCSSLVAVPASLSPYRKFTDTSALQLTGGMMRGLKAAAGCGLDWWAGLHVGVGCWAGSGQGSFLQ